MMDELLKGLARKLNDEIESYWCDFEGQFSQENGIQMLERVLREMGLGELLEAGQAMADCNWEYVTPAEHCYLQEKWDAAVERVRAALAGAEKGELKVECDNCGSRIFSKDFRCEGCGNMCSALATRYRKEK